MVKLPTGEGYVDIQKEAFLVLCAQERRDPAQLRHSLPGHSGLQLAEVGRVLWADRSELVGDFETAPLLQGAGRWHEPELVVEDGGVLDAVEGFHVVGGQRGVQVV